MDIEGDHRSVALRSQHKSGGSFVSGYAVPRGRLSHVVFHVSCFVFVSEWT